MKIGHAKNRRGENQFDSDHAFRSKYNRACLQNQDLYGELRLGDAVLEGLGDLLQSDLGLGLKCDAAGGARLAGSLARQRLNPQP